MKTMDKEFKKLMNFIIANGKNTSAELATYYYETKTVSLLLGCAKDLDKSVIGVGYYIILTGKNGCVCNGYSVRWESHFSISDYREISQIRMRKTMDDLFNKRTIKIIKGIL